VFCQYRRAKEFTIHADIYLSTQRIFIMDTSLINAITNTQANSEAAGIFVLKKANEVEAETALQLVAASSNNLPSHLGRNINTVA
jgi:hypothetical protein